MDVKTWWIYFLVCNITGKKLIIRIYLWCDTCKPPTV